MCSEMAVTAATSPSPGHYNTAAMLCRRAQMARYCHGVLPDCKFRAPCPLTDGSSVQKRRPARTCIGLRDTLARGSIGGDDRVCLRDVAVELQDSNDAQR